MAALLKHIGVQFGKICRKAYKLHASAHDANSSSSPVTKFVVNDIDLWIQNSRIKIRDASPPVPRAILPLRLPGQQRPMEIVVVEIPLQATGGADARVRRAAPAVSGTKHGIEGEGDSALQGRVSKLKL